MKNKLMKMQFLLLLTIVVVVQSFAQSNSIKIKKEHPRLILSNADIDLMRGNALSGIEPWKTAYEEAEHAAKFAELLGEVLTDSTKKNLEMRVEAENGATAGKMDLAKKAKELGLDAIHDTVHEMARDEARHGKAFAGLLARYFK